MDAATFSKLLMAWGCFDAGLALAIFARLGAAKLVRACSPRGVGSFVHCTRPAGYAELPHFIEYVFCRRYGGSWVDCARVGTDCVPVLQCMARLAEASPSFSR